MKAELKTKWLDGLRGGKYAQGEFTLRPASDKFCCLGVLCDLFSPEWTELTDGRFHHELRFGHPKNSGFELTGLTAYEANVLVEMNDIHKNTFAEIAGWIEANVPSE